MRTVKNFTEISNSEMFDQNTQYFFSGLPCMKIYNNGKET